MNSVLQERLLTFGSVLGAIVALGLLYVFVRHAFKAGRDKKKIVLACFGVLFMAGVTYFLINPLIEMSRVDTGRGRFKVGFESMCKHDPRYRDCAANQDCNVCGTRTACLGAVDTYYDRCYKALGDAGEVMPEKQFLHQVYVCMDQSSNCNNFGSGGNTGQ